MINGTYLMKTIVWMVLGASGLTACQIFHHASDEKITACPDRRPVACTLDYQPVCGFNDGGRGLRSYGNACGACTDAEVIGYADGVCKK